MECDHEFRRITGGYWRCAKCPIELIENNKHIKLIKQIQEMRKKGNQLASCLKMLKVATTTVKISDTYIEKEVAFTMLHSRIQDKNLLKEICKDMNIKIEEEE
jgi:hypothetical protein